MLNTEPLRQVIQELARVVALRGNAGRPVRRALERMFRVQEDGRLEAHFELRCDSEDLVLAFLASQVERDIARLAALFEAPAAAPFQLRLLPLARTRRSLVLEVVLQLPETLRERQALLHELGYVLDRLEESMSGMQYDIEAVFDFLYCDTEPDEALRTRGLAQFEQLVRGDLVGLAEVPVVLVSLAGRLNPAVRLEEHRLRAEPLEC